MHDQHPGSTRTAHTRCCPRAAAARAVRAQLARCPCAARVLRVPSHREAETAPVPKKTVKLGMTTRIVRGRPHQPDTQAACVQMHSITSTTSSAERNFAAFKKTMQDRCTILFK